MRKMPDEWYVYLTQNYLDLINGNALEYSKLKPSEIPENSGVYLISYGNDENEVPYYIGRTKNLRQRLYNNHLMGPLTNARLKKYLINSGECINAIEAKKFIKTNCKIRWILEKDRSEEHTSELQ